MSLSDTARLLISKVLSSSFVHLRTGLSLWTQAGKSFSLIKQEMGGRKRWSDSKSDILLRKFKDWLIPKILSYFLILWFRTTTNASATVCRLISAECNPWWGLLQNNLGFWVSFQSISSPPPLLYPPCQMGVLWYSETDMAKTVSSRMAEDFSGLSFSFKLPLIGCKAMRVQK